MFEVTSTVDAYDTNGDGYYDTYAVDTNGDGWVDGVGYDTNEDGSVDVIDVFF